MYFTQVIGLAFGLSPRRIGWGRNSSSIASLVDQSSRILPPPSAKPERRSKHALPMPAMPDGADHDMSEPRVGVYVCHCGHNIAGAVDVEHVAEWALNLPNVTISRNNRFMCAGTGQEQIEADIQSTL